jgi:hypothetical protein
VFFARFYTGKRLTRDEDAAAEEAGQRRVTNRPSGRLSYGEAMFDIGVNLTSSQFSRDRDEVVARAQAAGVTGMLLTGLTCMKASRRSSWRALYPLLVNGRRSSP